MLVQGQFITNQAMIWPVELKYHLRTNVKYQQMSIYNNTNAKIAEKFCALRGFSFDVFFRLFLMHVIMHYTHYAY